MNRFIIPLLCWLNCYVVIAEPVFSPGSAINPLQITSKTVNKSIVGHGEFLVDTDSTYTFEQLNSGQLEHLFQPFTQGDVNQGISKVTFWIRFIIENNNNYAIPWVLTPETSYIDNIELYVSTFKSAHNISAQWQTVLLSDFNVFSERKYQYRLLNAEFITPKNSSSIIYIKASSNTVEARNIQFYLSKSSLFSRYITNEYISNGLYYGALFAMMLIIMALWLLSNRFTYKIYACFLGYLISVTLMWASLDGLSFQYLWANSPILFNQSFHYLYLLVAIFAFIFSRYLLNIKQISIILDRIVMAIVTLFIGAIIIKALGFYSIGLYSSFLSLISLLLLPIIGGICYRPGKSYILIYILAWIPYSISLTLSVLSASTSFFSDFGMSILIFSKISVLFECFMLILATLYKIKIDSSKLDILKKQSLLDPLTNIGNRRYFDKHIQYIKSTSMVNRTFYLLMIDIDHFKQINDNYGHELGDQVLVSLAKLLQLECRSEDIAIRWGGEEFLLLLSIEDEKLALAIADRVRDSFKQYKIYAGDIKISCSLSIGMSKLQFLDHGSVKTALIDADKALYEAKNSGRNCIKVCA